jgi:hypothetical protein
VPIARATVAAVVIAVAVAAAAQARIVWSGDAEQPASAQWASSAANGPACSAAPPDMSTADVQRVTFPYPVAQGRYSYHFQVNDGDDCFGARAELGQGNPPNPRQPDRQFYAGQDRWISFQAFLPGDFQLDDPLGESTGLMQIKQQGADGKPALGIGNGEGDLCMYIDSTSYTHHSNHCGDGYYDLGQPAQSRWIKLTLHILFSTTSQGFVQVWGDLGDGRGYRLLLPRVYAPTMKADPTSGQPIPSQARIGIYRSLSITGTEDLYIDGFTVATDEQNAVENAFAAPSSSATSTTGTTPSGMPVTLGVVRHRARWVRVHGGIRARLGHLARVAGWRVIIHERVHRRWRIAARGHTAARGTFSMLLRIPRRHGRRVLLRATVVGVGRSNTAVVHLR